MVGLKHKMSKENYIYKYYQEIKNENITVGKWIRLVYEYVVQGLERKLFYFDQGKANNAIDWIENHAFHIEGDFAPNNLKLELWQKAMLSCMFGIVDEKGRRQFREVVLLVARKNGKSLLASAIGKYIWLLEGGYGAKVFCLAPKFDQADIIYLAIWQMTKLDPEWQKLDEQIKASREGHSRGMSSERLAKKRVSDLYLEESNSSVKRIAFNEKTSDGFNPSLAICDEVAAWQGDKGLKQYEVMKSGTGARSQSLLLSCTTAGYVNDSIYDELIKRSTRFLLGDSGETKLLPFLYMIDDVDKWNDINELRKSNPNMNVSVPVDFLVEEARIAEVSLSKKAEFLTKYCNIKQNSSLAWLPAQSIDAICGDPLKLEDFRGCYCVGGIDLSQTTDLTAAEITIERDGVLNVFAKFFMPAEKIELATERDGVPYEIYRKRGFLELSGENFVDYNDVFRWFKELIERFEILPLQVGYDRYSSQYLVNDMKNYGFHMDDVYQGDNLWGVIQEVEGIIKDKKINIGDNDLLKAHLLNSAIKYSTERNRGRLIKINPTSRIDGVAALLDTFAVRQKHYVEIGGQLENKRESKE